MEVDHYRSPDTRLQGCAGFLEGLFAANSTENHLDNIIRPSTNKPLIFAKPGPVKTTIQALQITQKRCLLKTKASSSLISTEGQN